MTDNQASKPFKARKMPFGLVFPYHLTILGTKGDVETFFLVLNDLIADGVLEDRYSTITDNLYHTLINAGNMDQYLEEVIRLEQAFSKIRSDRVSWDQYPYNREEVRAGEHRLRLDPSKPMLLEVFEFFFIVFHRSYRWLSNSPRDNRENSRIFIYPITFNAWHLCDKYTEEKIMKERDKPLWLREPG